MGFAEIVELLEQVDPAVRRVFIEMFRIIEAQMVTKAEFRELRDVVKELPEAQNVGEQRKIKEQIGGLTHTVGYVLEDRAYRGLPPLIERDFGVKVETLKRDYVEVSPDRYEEINIIGYGFRGSEKVWIFGDCKSQLKKRDVDSFLKTMKRIEEMFPGEKLVVFVAYQTSPQVRRYVEQKGCRVYFSYEFPV